MGFLAILRPSGQADGAVLRRCHLNVWVLSSLTPGRRLLYLDIGVELAAGDEPITSVDFLLPFQVDRGRWRGGAQVAQDLAPTLLTPTTSALVFGGPVKVNTEGDDPILSVGDFETRVRLLNVQSTAIKAVPDYDQRPDSNLYNVPLAKSIKPGEVGYIRTRWRVLGAAPLWAWKRIYGGAYFDFRVSDIREAKTAQDEQPLLRDRIMPIDQLNLFLIAPSKFQLGNVSPDLRYLRALEGPVWENYLRGASYLRRGNLLVYYWRTGGEPPPHDKPSSVKVHRPRTLRHLIERRHDQPKKVTADNAFRVFADFDRAVAGQWWLQVFRVVVALAVGYWILYLIRHPSVLSTGDWRSILTWIVGGTLTSLVAVGNLLRKAVSQRFLAIRTYLRRVERRILDWL